MLTHSIVRHIFIALTCAAIAGLAASPAIAARRFSGFDTSFAMGRSAASGAVCKADRDFDDPLVNDHTRAWTVTCRGWTIPLGRVYLFEGAHAQPPQKWRAEMASRAACGDDAAAADLPGGKVATCKTVPGDLPYLVLSLSTGRVVVLAEGMGPLGDVLTTAVKFVAGKIDEPAPISEQLASVDTAAKSGGLAAVDAGARPSLDSRREQAYRLDQAWEFDKAEQIFADLASSQSTPSGRVEALYNSALAVSNEGRFDEANFYFKQADDQAAQIGADASLRALALNYRAAHARNQRNYQAAVGFAEQAIAERREATAGTAAVNADADSIRIADGGFASGFSATRLTAEERNALQDVQAMQIEATSLEALGREDQARDVLQKAVAILDAPMLVAGSTKPPTLGFASPRLDTQVRMDVLRLDRNIGRAADATPQAEAAIAAFRKKYPGSLPLAGFLIELARAEAAAGQEDRALSDYEDAFSIFRNQRGALGASTDLIGTYFDILLKQIGDAPARHQSEVGRFFAAAQTLAAPSSAEAAKRQTARVMGSDSAAAGLARGLDDVERSIELKQQEIRDLREQGLYQGAAKTRADNELAELATEDKALQGQLAAANLGYESELRRFIGLDELQKTLRPGEAYVKVFMLANRGYGMLVTADSARPYSIEMGRSDAQAMVDGLRKPIDRLSQMEHPALGRYDVALAHDAFERLFGPVKTDLLSAKVAIYEPDITLIGIPIAALVTDDASVAAMKANLDRARRGDTDAAELTAERHAGLARTRPGAGGLAGLRLSVYGHGVHARRRHGRSTASATLRSRTIRENFAGSRRLRQASAARRTTATRSGGACSISSRCRRPPTRSRSWPAASDRMLRPTAWAATSPTAGSWPWVRRTAASRNTAFSTSRRTACCCRRT